MYITTSPFAQGDSVIHQLDTRAKIIIAVLFTLLFIVTTRLLTLFMGLGLAIFLISIAHLSPNALWTRLRILNSFTLLSCLLLPLTIHGTPYFHIGTLTASQEGISQALLLTLKSNVIMLFLTVLLSTVESVTLGHALSHLHMPNKLIQLLFFTIRYIEVLQTEYQRLTRAMTMRGFRARSNWHTYRSLAYLIGMLLVRSLDRSERIFIAMKCRGFHGQFLLLKHFSWQSHDSLLSLGLIGLLLGLVAMEWGC